MKKNMKSGKPLQDYQQAFGNRVGLLAPDVVVNSSESVAEFPRQVIRFLINT